MMIAYQYLDDVAVGLVVGLLAAGGFALVSTVRQRKRLLPASHGRRVLFPFVGRSISYGALDAAIRLANADHATLVPVFLARVPMRLALDAATPIQASIATELLEAIEQRTLRAGVAVDSRIVRGRTAQHALQLVTGSEQYYRIVLPAESRSADGLDADAITWCLDHAPGEIVVLRPGSEAPKRRFSPTFLVRA